jgi:hypothetical protein
MVMTPDYDQSGTARQSIGINLGPSIGWTGQPTQSVLNVASAGTFTLDPGQNVVNVNVAGAVTIILPSAKLPSVVASTQPSLFAKPAVTVVDVGGNAGANPITIQAKSGEAIMGLASIQITTTYGAFTLQPTGGGSWSEIMP